MVSYGMLIEDTIEQRQANRMVARI